MFERGTNESFAGERRVLKETGSEMKGVMKNEVVVLGVSVGRWRLWVFCMY